MLMFLCLGPEGHNEEGYLTFEVATVVGCIVRCAQVSEVPGHEETRCSTPERAFYK